VPKESFLTCSDERSPFNNILREESISKKEYQLISKEQWAFIEANYAEKQGGKIAAHALHPIRRYYEKLGMGIRTSPDVQYHRVSYLPHLIYIV
jgi:hypothetical protein